MDMSHMCVCVCVCVCVCRCMCVNLPANAGDSKEAGLIPGSGKPAGGGNGNPLQCSCLENPRDGGWAAVYGVAQSRTRLK